MTRRGSGSPEVPGDPEQPLGDPETVARTICLRMLDRRAYSRRELADALERRGVPGPSADTVLNRFTELGLIDDRGLAAALAGAQHRERALSQRAVAAKLRRRGLAQDDIAEAVAPIDGRAEQARAEAFVQSRLGGTVGLDRQVRMRRLVGALARKGYAAELAYDVVRRALDAEATTVESMADRTFDEGAGSAALTRIGDLRRMPSVHTVGSPGVNN